MTVTVYKSTDVGAPTMTGVTGDLGFINILEACLVTGYGTQVAAGWSKDFVATNVAVFRAPLGNRHYLQVDETSAQYPTLRAFVTMTNATTGTKPYPTTPQLSGGIKAVKSSTTTAVSRPWIVIANGRAFYFWSGFGLSDIGTTNTSVDMLFFGDIVSYLPGDVYNSMLIGKTTADTTVNNTRLGTLSTTGAESLGHYLASSFLQDGNSCGCGCLASALASAVTVGTAGVYYPDPITGGMLLDTIRVVEGGTAAKKIRGHLPGVFNPQHVLPGGHLDTLTGRGALAGHNLLVLYRGGTDGRFVVSMHEDDWHG